MGSNPIIGTFEKRFHDGKSLLKHGRAVVHTAAKKRKETKFIRQLLVKPLARVCDGCGENLN